MFEKLSRSWALVKASASVLQSDRELLVFPLLSGIASLIVAASFVLPILAGGVDPQQWSERGPATWLFTFAFYLVQYFVIIFFNAALVGAALIRLDGGDPTVADGLRIARSRLPQILGYAAISATVGMLLRALQERAGFLGRLIGGLFGVAWTVASFLVVPVLVTRRIGPWDAVMESGSLLKRSWGENLAGNAGIGIAFTLIYMLGALAFVGLIVLATSISITLVWLRIATMVVTMIGLAMVQSALQGIYSAALYRYASGQSPGAAFPPALVTDAFRIK